MRVMMLFLSGALAFADFTVPERKFVEQAASEDLAAVELSRLALDKSTSKATRGRAQSMIDERQQSLDQLKRIASDQHFALPTSPTTRADEDHQKLAKLDGEAFDREYRKIMDRRHDAAIATFEKADLQNPDLKSYAADALPKLKQRH